MRRVRVIDFEESAHEAWPESQSDFPVEDWQFEVANNDTRLGYEEWVEARRSSEYDEK